MPKTKKIPLRQCIACRELKPKKEMLRIVKNKEGAIFLDFSGKAQGRGAYICDDENCIKKLRKQRLINKVFSCEVDESVYAAIEEEYFGKR
ncbi:MAG TPA: YlxR family protein [Candidatus Coproplasma excrementipullorum]|nr:YlxR family protein [Candidatus Coproplasma excrementipullorum]